jgi:tetratricopeptide (TPR) repeat protein
VAKYLVAASTEEDAGRAYQYAQAARELAARVGIVRETCGIAAYQAEQWADALTEFRAARRLTGRNTYLPLMADCERGLDRLDRALDLVTGRDAQAADRATQVELKIVESGIRRDQGLPEAGVVALQIPELTDKRGRASARLLYAYADALLDAGREDEARQWFEKAAAADRGGETDAAERLNEFDGVLIEDLDDELDDDELDEPGGEDLAANSPGDEPDGNDGPEDDEAEDNDEPEDEALDEDDFTDKPDDELESGEPTPGDPDDEPAEAELAEAEQDEAEQDEDQPADDVS